jgi:hypothetical protein
VNNVLGYLGESATPDKINEILAILNLDEKENIRFQEFCDIVETLKYGAKELDLPEDVIADIEDIFEVFDTKQVKNSRGRLM